MKAGPETNVRPLFFSGGTALRALCRRLPLYTQASIHLVTPFDSGGSSAQLRKAFEMLSVGDLRNRLMALADPSQRGSPEIFRLFSTRLPTDGDPAGLRNRLEELSCGRDPLIASVPQPMRELVRAELQRFVRRMPEDFDLRNASIGNLILTGSYLSDERDIDAVVSLFSRLAGVRGIVRPIVDEDLHLAAVLADGTRVIGQHQLTGKTAPPIRSPVVDLFLVDHLLSPERVEPQISEGIRGLIRSADLICYPMGSFYSSVIANLLPRGVGSEIRASTRPKVYVPNLGTDPEQLGMTVGDAVMDLARFVARDLREEIRPGQVVSAVVIDSLRGRYETPLDLARIEALGVEVRDVQLVDDSSSTSIDPDRLIEVLLSFC